MEEISIIQAISNVGFPIVMCFILLKYVTKMEENHKNEITELSKSLQANTNAIEKLTIKLEEIRK